MDYINAPWGRVFYRLVWHNLGFRNKRILDFGSGFGVTANHLAGVNDVTAVEPDREERMFVLECAVESEPVYANVAFFQHLILRKNKII